uniref:Ty3 transposon capsid-like protein domain-containing protein n=1 Tax=Kryptolebias marmoratus TaxID=37003 RepID=A0A3Q3AJP0_KRYMA
PGGLCGPPKMPPHTITDPLPNHSGGGQAADMLVHHEQRLDQYETLINQLFQVQQDACSTLDQVSHRLVDLNNRLGTLIPTMPPVSAAVTVPRPPLQLLVQEPELKPAECFDGDTDRCGGFLLQCNFAFARSPSLFVSHASKIIYIVSVLKGRALRWAQAFLNSHPIETLLSQRFIQEFLQVFDHPFQHEEAAKRLLNLRQGRRSVADFSVNFRITAVEAGWEELALKGVFINSLSENIKDELASRDEPGSLDGLISLAIRIDNRLREPLIDVTRPRSEIHSSPSINSSFLSGESEPMQVRRTQLSPEERQRRFRANACIYCGNQGHFVDSGPAHLDKVLWCLLLTDQKPDQSL